jgi:D-glycero-D-manno-heptose 1,7-bisphosphate phosphatase
MNKGAIILDRDGVINYLVERGYARTSPYNLAEVEFMPRIFEAFDLIKELSYSTFVITNQPGLLLCQISAINNHIKKRLGINQIYSAIDPTSNDYKPNDGLFKKIIKEHKVDPFKSFMIGDRWKDIVPAYKTGFTTFFVGDHYWTPEEYCTIRPNYIVSSAYDAILLIKGIKGQK